MSPKENHASGESKALEVTTSARLSFASLRETYPYDEKGNICPTEAV
jgi:hypothetical protein